MAFFQIRRAQASPTVLSASQVATQLQSIYKGTYGRISGGNSTGYINALLEDLDNRMTELKGRFTSSTPTCLSNSPSTINLDLSHINSAFKLSLDVQCYDLFNGAGDQSASGSGMVFGKSTSGDYSLWLGLNHSSTSGFGYAARVYNPDSATDKSIDMIFVEGESMFSRGTLSRLKAQPAKNKYELIYVSNQASGISPISGGSAVSIGCGLNLISDGTLIYVSGKSLSSGSDCSTATAFEACLSATDLSANATLGACDTLKASFTISSALSTISSASIPVPSSSEMTLYNAIQISNANSLTSAVKQ